MQSSAHDGHCVSSVESMTEWLFEKTWSLGWGRDSRTMATTPTCVVVLGAVSQVLLFLQDKLRQGQSVSHLHGSLLLPLKDEVIHGVANWGGGRKKLSHH